MYQHLDSLENCKHFVLKGNLEMTLASRLSTLANLLDANTKEIGNSKYWTVAWANLALVQLQAIIVGTLAAIFALFMHWLSSCSQPSLAFDIDQEMFLVLLTSSVLTASIASLVLGVVMIEGNQYLLYRNISSKTYLTTKNYFIQESTSTVFYLQLYSYPRL